MVEMKEILARAAGIVERLSQYTAIEKAEIIALVQAYINVELARANRELTQAHLAGLNIPPQATFSDQVVQNVKRAIGVADE